MLKRALEWFKPYLTKIQENELTTANLKARYIFLIWEGFCKYIIQMFKSLDKELMAENKLKIL